jgi:hypothetical protein
MILEYKFQLSVFFKIGFSNLFKYFILYSLIIYDIVRFELNVNDVNKKYENIKFQI